jgi:hypothetical protein
MCHPDRGSSVATPALPSVRAAYGKAFADRLARGDNLLARDDIRANGRRGTLLLPESDREIGVKL